MSCASFINALEKLGFVCFLKNMHKLIKRIDEIQSVLDEIKIVPSLSANSFHFFWRILLFTLRGNFLWMSKLFKHSLQYYMKDNLYHILYEFHSSLIVLNALLEKGNALHNEFHHSFLKLNGHSTIVNEHKKAKTLYHEELWYFIKNRDPIDDIYIFQVYEIFLYKKLGGGGPIFFGISCIIILFLIKIIKNNKTLLHYAAEKNLKEVGELLILKGADINAKDIIYLNI